AQGAHVVQCRGVLGPAAVAVLHRALQCSDAAAAGHAQAFGGVLLHPVHSDQIAAAGHRYGPLFATAAVERALLVLGDQRRSGRSYPDQVESVGAAFALAAFAGAARLHCALGLAAVAAMLVLWSGRVCDLAAAVLAAVVVSPAGAVLSLGRRVGFVQ